jgi:hypothetical protein
MPLDTTHTRLGFELALLRALGEGRRRQSLADRLLRERRDGEAFPEVRIAQMILKVSSLSQSPAEP